MIRVFIPGYNNLHEMLTCLTTLRDTAGDEDVHFTVLDDTAPETFAQNGMDPELGFSQTMPRDVLYCRQEGEQLGFAANCNRALRSPYSPHDIFFFVNQDVYADIHSHWASGWAETLARCFGDHPAVGIVGIRLLMPDGSLQHAGVIFDGACQPTHRFLGYKDSEYLPAMRQGLVPAVTGAALAIRASLFSELGGFDSVGYPGGYFEDIDLCCRAQQIGSRVWYEPSIAFHHKVGTSGGSGDFMRNAHVFKSRWVDTGAIEPDTHIVREDFWV